MKQLVLLMLISPLAYAELSADVVLKQVYKTYDKKHQCWIAKWQTCHFIRQR